MKKLISLLLCCMFLFGCTTTRNVVEPNSYQILDDGVKYYDYDIEILSDPEGADIEWNKKIIGTTPLTKTFNGYIGTLNKIVVKAYPADNGQYVQTIILGGTEPIPNTLYFNMNEEPAKIR